MRIDDIKKLTAWEILQLLQQKTKENSLSLKENTNLIMSIVQGGAVYKSIRELQEKNNDLLMSNANYLKLHNNLLTFLKSLLSTGSEPDEVEPEAEPAVSFELIEEQPLDFEECFEQTINGIMDFDENHPFYNSKDFRTRLLQYYIEKEDYEKCALLVNKAQ